MKKVHSRDVAPDKKFKKSYESELISKHTINCIIVQIFKELNGS